MAASSHTLPPNPAQTGPGRKRSGPVPAWALKLGTALATLSIFAGSFGYAGAHLYATNAPLQPAVVAAATSASTTATVTLGSAVRTTTRAAVTNTRSS
ncbi:MAG TPA: hypothetical protein VGR87_06535 [Candidatus Limnocylindria bacterium]|nr:hypothetical protein [Candidatus Limnocylindria bacterium]